MIGQFTEYKGYIGSIEYDSDDNLFHGSIINTRDYVGYHANNIFDLEKQFHDAVDDYIEFKKEIEEII